MLTNELKMFAGDNTTFYDAVMSYFCDKNVQTIENKSLINPAFFAEVERKAGVSREGTEIGAWMANPNTKWVK